MRLTHHAVEQFASRFGGTEAQLHILAAEAVPSKLRTPKGQEIWLCGEGGAIRLVVKRDPGKREPVCVTVLPLHVERADDEPGEPLADTDTPSVRELVDQEDNHVVAAAAEVDAARAETALASELFSATRSFLMASKVRLQQARARLHGFQTPKKTP